MYQIIKFLATDAVLPGDNSGSIKSKEELEKEKLADNADLKKGEPKDESVIDKIKDALQDWSNDNEKDIEEDDRDALKSNL